MAIRKIFKEVKGEVDVIIQAGDIKKAIIQAYKQIKAYGVGKLNRTGAITIRDQLKPQFKKNKKQKITLDVNYIIKMNILGEI